MKIARTADTLQQTDDVAVHIGVEERNRLEVSKKLSGLLASSYVLNLKTLYYHWNVTGPQFVGLHTLFEQQYNELSKAGDEIAERIRALGHFTPGTVTEFMQLSSVKDDASLPKSSQEMVKNLLNANERCSAEARKVLEAAEKAGDEVTVDMMVGRMTSHDKSAWMLRSLLQ